MFADVLVLLFSSRFWVGSRRAVCSVSCGPFRFCRTPAPQAPPALDRLISQTKELFALPGVPEYQLRLNWKSPGDLTLYDNRAVQHYGVADYGLVL